MALQKDIEVRSTGVVASYWKIGEMTINWHHKQAMVVLWGFKDQAARQAGKLPIDHRVFEFRPDNFPFTFDGNNVAEAYQAIKNYSTIGPNGEVIPSEFADALDV